MPSLLDEGLDKALLDLIGQWNVAEERIKKAEQVQGDVVSSAIFELRYAGRKVIDSIEIALKQGAKDHEAREKIHSYIADAIEDCVKAKHDAIDAALDFVTFWFRKNEDALGLAKVQVFFPDYLALTAKISEIQDKIAESRKDRNSLRDTIYNAIDADGSYDEILALYKRMLLSRDRVAAVVRRERIEKIIMYVATAAGVILEPIQKVVESGESVVIPCEAPESLSRGAGCGSLNTEWPLIEAASAIRAI